MTSQNIRTEIDHLQVERLVKLNELAHIEGAIQALSVLASRIDAESEQEAPGA